MITTRLAACLLVPMLAFGETVTFRQGVGGYAGTQDTMLLQASPTANSGSQPTLDVVNGTQKQGLIRFDNIVGTGAGQIPPGAQILAATLSVNVWAAGSGVAVHRMQSAWSEASTWNSLVNGIQIGDTEAAPTAEDTKSNLALGVAVFTVTRAVQDWANGMGNHGCALLPAGSGTTVVRLDSSESTFTTELPLLSVTYQVASVNPPTVALTAPADGAVITLPAAVSAAATAADSDGTVTKVEFYANGAKLAEDTTAPYGHTWTAAAGAYTLTAVAQDNAGNRTTSAPRSITVQPASTVPTVAIVAPANGGVIMLPDAVNCQVTASGGASTIAKVEFYQNGVLLDEDLTLPYELDWVVGPGAYTLTAVAEDQAGQRLPSSPVAITIVLPNPMTTVALTVPANGAVVTLPAPVVCAASAASGNGSIVKVEFYAGASMVGEDSTAPYECAWTAPAAGLHTLRAVAQDSSGGRVTSASRTITAVAPSNVPPTVALTAPVAGAVIVLPNTVNFAATAADSDGSITKVDFYLGDMRVSVDATAPYSCSWLASAGSYVLTAVVQDNTGARTTSAPVPVTVVSSNALPAPSIKVNGVDGPVTLRSADVLSATIDLAPGVHAGQTADWFALAHDVTRDVWYQYVAPFNTTSWSAPWNGRASMQSELFALSAYEVLRVSGLAAGQYDLYFGFDLTPNGVLDDASLYYDRVEVRVTP